LSQSNATIYTFICFGPSQQYKNIFVCPTKIYKFICLNPKQQYINLFRPITTIVLMCWTETNTFIIDFLLGSLVTYVGKERNKVHFCWFDVDIQGVYLRELVLPFECPCS